MKRVILIGLSGSGKSTIARSLAERLGFEPVDIDDEIVKSFGYPIREIFTRHGEAVFRAAESEILFRACAHPERVIAVGGGAVVSEQNWVAMRPESLIVHLQAAPDELIARLRSQVVADPTTSRPLLESSDPLPDLERQWVARRDMYAQADVCIDTTRKAISEVVDEVGAQVRAAHSAEYPLPIVALGTATGRSDLYVAPGILASAGDLVRKQFPASRRGWIISDANVAPLWGAAVAGSLARAGFATTQLTVAAGESSKSMQQTSALLDRLLTEKINRRDVVVALGGGVVGDLAGFVAAIVLRGVGLVQIPTSLLAMVDSSVGGKTGIDHERGKNLIGAFYQPQLVLADPLVLETLPEREWRAGWAEIIKHAMIEMTATGRDDAQLLSLIESTHADALYDTSVISEVIAQNVRVKSAVVSRDERESGLRRVLNYGHTLGHAMEASGYRYIHGEAIALGMRAAVNLAIRLGYSTDDVASRQNAMLDRIGLPNQYEGQLSDVIDRLWSDKKTVNGVLTWILPGRECGRVDIRSDVPLAQVEAAAQAVGARR